MPSETPYMPGETYRSLLKHGSSKGLGLQAGEVAWYPNPRDASHQIARYAKRLVIVLATTLAVIMFIGFKSAL